MFDENKWNEENGLEGSAAGTGSEEQSQKTEMEQPGSGNRQEAWNRPGYEAQNYQGIADPSGSQNHQGPQNSTGSQSYQGPQNSTGGQSYQAPQNPTGGQSYQGPQNPSGSQSYQGPQNPSGSQNYQGPQNPSGGQSYQGTADPTGGQNCQGAANPTGGYNYQGTPDSANYQNRQAPNGQAGYQGRSPYSSPYPYSGGYNQNQPSGDGMGNAPAGGSHKKPKKNSFMKTTAMVTAAALLFGVVSGGTMYGVNRAAQLIFPAPAQSTQAALENTPTVPAAQPSSTQTTGGAVIEDVSSIVEAAMPSVVAITNTMLYKSNNWFGPSQTYEVPSSGSGIIVGQNDSELLIVTNNHVIEGSTSLQVTFIDESTVEAAVKGTDSESDLAVIAVPLDSISADTKTQIKAATLGDSDALKMGQGVIAIGNALGHGQSVTVGHVSALNREIQVDGLKKTVIQTDAAINPGNSGGALLNANGELIGINEAKYASTEVEGVGYAIPISYAKDIIDDLKSRTTKIEVAVEEQGYLGIQVQNVDSQTAQMYGMPQGVYVYKITEGSAAADSDLREMDIITKFDGETVRSYADLTNLLTYYKAGSTINLTVQSLENGQYVERQVQVTLKERPQEEQQDSAQKGNSENSGRQS